MQVPDYLPLPGTEWLYQIVFYHHLTGFNHSSKLHMSTALRFEIINDPGPGLGLADCPGSPSGRNAESFSNIIDISIHLHF